MIGKVVRDDEGARPDGHVVADADPGQHDASAPSHEPAPMHTGRSAAACRPTGRSRSRDVVLIGHVDVGPGVDVVADLHLEVADDLVPRPMTHRSPMVTISSAGATGRGPCRPRATRTAR